MATIVTSATGDPVRTLLLPAKIAGSHGLCGVAFLPGGITRMEVRLHATPAEPGHLLLHVLPLTRVGAALALAGQNRRTFWAALRSGTGSAPSRLRRALLQATTKGPQAIGSYEVWLRLYDQWPTWRTARFRSLATSAPTFAALVVGEAGSPAMEATLQSIAQQIHPVTRTVVAGGSSGEEVAEAASAAPFVLVLAAGEVLAPHASLLLAAELSGRPAEILYADEDRIAPDGLRSSPSFKPQPGLPFMCSGLLSRGVWAIRSAWLEPTPGGAEALRLRAWFRQRAAFPKGDVRRVAHLLTHRRDDADTAPPASLAAIVDAGLQEAGVDATASREFPLRLRWRKTSSSRVSLVIPSRLRGETQSACLIGMLERTDHANLHSVIVVTQAGPLDDEQQRTADLLRRRFGTEVTVLNRSRFNYSAANNAGVATAASEFVCLMNDDVSVLDGDWLDRMVAVMSDREVGIVGAKLLYPDMTVQHGGVIAGLAGLAEHAGRGLRRDAPGYMHRAVLDQDLSIVTAACMLVRRNVFEALGGFDETLPTAFNDVDFCLRARAAGHRVVFAASVELVHHESASFGHHYAHDPEQEMVDVRRMQERWAEACGADPFHNPNLSLMFRHEWHLAFPPRPDPFSALPQLMDDTQGVWAFSPAPLYG